MNRGFSRRTGWLVLTLVFLAITAAIVIRSRTRALPRFIMADGSIVSVVSVQVGTNSVYPIESAWRRYVRQICPDRWEASMLGKAPNAPAIRTRNDSLLLWIRNRGADGKPTGDVKWAQSLVGPSASPRETPTISAYGSAVSSALGVAGLEFQTYARDARWIPLKIWNGIKYVTIEVANPQRLSPARWQAGPLPQTNRLAGSDVILQPIRMYGLYGPDAFDPRLVVKSRGWDRAGWVEWHATVMDQWGNWSESGWPMKSSRLMLHCAGLLGDVWRIQANGVEYLSAGFVPSLTNGAISVVPVGPRAKEFGVRHLIAMGAGAYQIQDGEAAYVGDKEAQSLRIGQLSVVTSAKAGSWQVTLAAPYPGVLCVTEGNSQHKARLRTRPGRMDGQNVFVQSTSDAGGRRRNFHFFSRHFPAVAREELELEVFGPLPLVEYYIAAPRTTEWNASESRRTP